MSKRCNKGFKRCITGDCIKISSEKTKNKCKKDETKCADNNCYKKKSVISVASPKTSSKISSKKYSNSIYLPAHYIASIDSNWICIICVLGKFYNGTD